MRAGGCTLQQGLTAEAAGVVKQAVTVARKRGHAQVTPLHVASTMLSSTTGLLRTACLQSHSHPLQCKALELCFNVALNRLPASNSSPMLSHHHHHHGHHSQNPSISNALIAAFKRAQAHQRRGSIENQQQPLLAVKIEVEQLIISILDDPSVSRVMREAGFSSTQVKSKVEQVVSLEICTAHQSNKSKESSSNNNNGSKVGKPGVTSNPVRTSDDEDVMSVVECLVRKKKKSIVVVGECIDDIEGVVRGVMEKVEKQNVPEALKGVKFITLKLSSLGNHSSRVEVEQKLGEIKSLLRGTNNCVAKGVILYLGDLKWTTTSISSDNSTSTSSSSGDHMQEGKYYNSYCPKEHMIMEIGKLLCGNNAIGEILNARFWLMGVATFQTYMRCKSGHRSLETVWGIHPLTIPAGSLGFSLLTTQSELQRDESTSKSNNGTSMSLIVEGTINHHHHLTCCTECSAKFEAEARTLKTINIANSSSNLPAWLQQSRNEAKPITSSNHDHKISIELYKKWNSYCYSNHQDQQQQNNNSSEKTLINFSSVSPNSSSSVSAFSYDRPLQYQNPINDQFSWRDKNLWSFDQSPNRKSEPILTMYFPENKENNPSKQPMLFSPNPNSASSSDVVMETEHSHDQHKFKDLNSENLKTLIDGLERRVPCQKEIIPYIASTILKCRSGLVTRRKGGGAKEETWLLFQGIDALAKQKICRELARLIFGSQDEFVSIVALSSFSSTRADSTEDCFGTNNINNKRSRDEQSYCSYIERFGEAVSMNPRRVFLVEDVEQADYGSRIGFKRAMERGKVMNSSGEEVDLRDAIVVLSCESFSSRSRACSPKTKQKISIDDQSDGNDGDETSNSPCLSLDLNISFDEQEENHVAEDDDEPNEDIRLLESVDKRVVFKNQEL